MNCSDLWQGAVHLLHSPVFAGVFHGFLESHLQFGFYHSKCGIPKVLIIGRKRVQDLKFLRTVTVYDGGKSPIDYHISENAVYVTYTLHNLAGDWRWDGQ